MKIFLTVSWPADAENDDTITSWNGTRVIEFEKFAIDEIQKLEQLDFDDRFFGEESSLESIKHRLETTITNE